MRKLRPRVSVCFDLAPWSWAGCVHLTPCNHRESSEGRHTRMSTRMHASTHKCTDTRCSAPFSEQAVDPASQRRAGWMWTRACGRCHGDMLPLGGAVTTHAVAVHPRAAHIPGALKQVQSRDSLSGPERGVGTLHSSLSPLLPSTSSCSQAPLRAWLEERWTQESHGLDEGF